MNTASLRSFDTAQVEREFRLAVREALIDHARFGNPIAIERDGRTETVQPEDIPALLGLSMDEVFGPPSRRRPAEADAPEG